MGYAGIVAIPIPDDGTTGQVLTKSTNADYDMQWAAGGGGGSVADGDYVDITVSGVGTIWTIDPGVVTYAKMQNISGPSLLLGRGDSGAGVVQEISLGTNLAMVGTVLNAVGAGASVDGSWRFSTSTVAADPGNRNFRLDNATLASVTAIYINDTTVNGFDASTILGFLRAGNRIYIQQKNDATRAALFLVTGTATDNIGWWTVPVTTILDGGVLYQNNAECGFVLLLSAGVVTDADYGDITVSAAGTLWTIDNDVVTYAKMQNVSAASLLLGRGSAGGAGDPQEITLGTNLSMAGTTLNAAAGGGGTITQVTATLPYPAQRSNVINIIDATMAATDKILVTLAGVADTQANAGFIEVLYLAAVAKAGSFDLVIETRVPEGGPVVINYSRAA
jgi:hypothetical protein